MSTQFLYITGTDLSAHRVVSTADAYLSSIIQNPTDAKKKALKPPPKKVRHLRKPYPKNSKSISLCV